MPHRRDLKGGGIEYIDTDIEAEFKKKFKSKKKPADLTTSEMKEIVFLLAQKFRLIK